MILHPNAADLAGLRRGLLTVERADGRAADGHLAWLCRCDCGRAKRISSNSLTRSAPVQSCGCLNRVRGQAKRKAGGPWNEGKNYVIGGGEHCYKTRHGWALAAIRRYGNRCERCEWDEARCDVHHRHAKADGGPHTLANAIVICPNCHRIEHDRGGA